MRVTIFSVAAGSFCSSHERDSYPLIAYVLALFINKKRPPFSGWPFRLLIFSI